MGEEEKLILNHIEDEEPTNTSNSNNEPKISETVDENQNAHSQIDFGNVQIKREIDSDGGLCTRTSINYLNGVTDAVIKCEPDDQLHQEFKYESQSESEDEVMEQNKRKRKKVDQGPATCSNFFKQSTRAVKLNKLSSDSSSKRLFSCDKCLYVGISRANLERHTLLHLDPSDIKWYNCTECSYKTKYEHQLKSHFMVHRNPEEINFFQCPHCELKCSRKHNLTHHIKSIHSAREYLFCCAECEYKTFTKERLAAHVKTHSKEVFKCELCKFITKHDKYLQAHVKLVHTDVIKRFLCDTCSYKGKTKRELDRHYDRMHKKENLNIFQCNKCNFQSIYKKNLEHHFLHVHQNSEGFNKFICGHCDKQFAYKNGLKTHIIRCHIRLPEEEYHKCLVCKYKSKCLNTLKRHIKRNHGEPRLNCEKCNFKTNRQISMEAHMKTHDCDETDILKCPDCPYRIIQMTSFLYHLRVIHQKQLSAKEAIIYQNCSDSN